MAETGKTEKEPARLDLVPEPMGASFKFGATRKVDAAQLAKMLASIPDIEIVEQKGTVCMIKVDSRDIDGMPYLFTIVYFNKDNIEVLYTITPEISLRKRRLELLRFLVNAVTILSDAYDIDLPSFMQLLDVFLADIKEFATLDYEKLFTRYDAALAKLEEAKKKIERLTESNERLSKDVLEITNQRNELRLKLDELEKYSDDALMIKVQEWIKEHNNEINIGDFCKLYKVNESRVEQILNKMVREGYLEVRR